MKNQFLARAAFGAWTFAVLPSVALAKQESPMVGHAVERAADASVSENTTTVMPVVVKPEVNFGSVTSPTAQATAPSGTGIPSMGTLPGSSLSTAPSSKVPSTTSPSVARLNIQAGQRLSVALSSWLRSQGIDLSWEPAGTLPGRIRDVVIDSAWLASQSALEPTLTEVLAPFGLTAHVLRQRQANDASSPEVLNTSPSSVVVRNASNARP